MWLLQIYRTDSGYSMEHMKKPILGLCWSLVFGLSFGSSQTINIQSTKGMQGYQIAQIAKITPRTDSTIYDLTNGSSYTTVTAGQKWTFGGITPVAKVNSNLANTKFSVDNNVLSVRVEIPSQFTLCLLNGSLVAENNKLELKWNIELKPLQIYVLNVQNQSSNQSYLIQSSN